MSDNKKFIELFITNKYFIVGTILAILEYSIFKYTILDQIFGIQLFNTILVAHHFLEIPAFFFFGMGVSKFTHDLNWSSRKANMFQIIAVVIALFIPMPNNFEALWTKLFFWVFEIVGFYYYRLFE